MMLTSSSSIPSRGEHQPTEDEDLTAPRRSPTSQPPLDADKETTTGAAAWVVSLQHYQRALSSGNPVGVTIALRHVLGTLIKHKHQTDGGVVQPSSSAPSGSMLSRWITSNTSMQPHPSPLLQGASLEAIVRSCLRLALTSGEGHLEATVLARILYTDRWLEKVPKFGGSAQITLERIAVRQARSLIHRGEWLSALRVVETHAVSDMSLAVAIEALCSGQVQRPDWASAVAVLGTMRRSSWTEMELSCITTAMLRWLRHPAENAETGDSTVLHHKAVPLWEASIRLFRACVLSRQQRSSVGFVSEAEKLPSSIGAFLSTSSSVSNLFGILGRSERWMEALRLAECSLSELGCGGRLSSDAVTVGQLMFALRPRWNVALATASKFIGSLPLSSAGSPIDGRALDSILAACLSGKQWATAVDVFSRSQQGGPELRISAKMCLRLLKTLTSVSSEQSSVRSSTASSAESHDSAYTAAQHVATHAHLCAHSNHDALSRSLNWMVQHAHSLHDAQHWSHQLQQGGLTLENESFIKLVELHAKVGDWLSAMRALDSVMNDPQRRSRCLLQPVTHDWVQYAIGSQARQQTNMSLSRTHQTLPLWEVSLRLFMELTLEHHVPISETAFQCAVRTCFSAGRADKANELFAFTLRRGIGRR